jgi:hypothetical protein
MWRSAHTAKRLGRRLRGSPLMIDASATARSFA